MVYVDEIEMDQEGIAEMMLDENAIAQVARKNNFLLSMLKQQELFWSGLTSVMKQYVLRWGDVLWLLAIVARMVFSCFLIALITWFW